MNTSTSIDTDTQEIIIQFCPIIITPIINEVENIAFNRAGSEVLLYGSKQTIDGVEYCVTLQPKVEGGGVYVYDLDFNYIGKLNTENNIIIQDEDEDEDIPSWIKESEYNYEIDEPDLEVLYKDLWDPDYKMKYIYDECDGDEK